MSKETVCVSPEALRKIAIALFRAGNAEDAAMVCRDLLEQTPGDIDLLFLAATAELQCANPLDACILLSALLSRDPAHVKAWVNRGVALLELGRKHDALDDFSAAVRLAPNDVDARYNRGSVYLALGRNYAALADFDAVLAQDPTHMGAANNRGNALRALHRSEDALRAYDTVIAQAPNHVHARYNRAVVLCELDRPDEALNACNAVLAQKPDYAEAHCCRANALRELGRYEDALAAYDAARTLHPDYADAIWDRSLVELLLGQYETGWANYEYRWRTALPRPELWQDRALWQGERLTGKTLLLHAEQGLGDTLQFCRYVPMAARSGARVLFRAPESLRTLLSTLRGNFTLTGETKKNDYDVHCPLMSLPRIFATRPETISETLPQNGAYLHPDPQRVRTWAKRIGDKTAPRIGIVWSGRAGLAPDRTRSAPLARLTALLGLPFEFHCLQKEIRPADRAVAAQFPNLHLHDDALNDFADTAALIAQMDLTLSVDTSVAHAAGATGAPVWLMLPFAPDWRWFLSRSDSPWYPSARLFRQPTRGDWDGVADALILALRERFAV